MRTQSPDMLVSIRSAHQADYEALCALWAQADAWHARIQPGFFRSSSGAPRPLKYLRDALLGPSQRILVAEIAERVVGMVHAQVFDTPDHVEKTRCKRGYVEDLIVEENHRRCGIGRTLMEAVVTWCRQQGADQVVLTVWAGNGPAETFYQQLGYRPVSHVLCLDL